MLFDEYDYDMDMQVRYEEGLEDGLEKGRANTLLYAIRSLIETTKCSSEDAMEKLMIPAEDRAALLAQL